MSLDEYNQLLESQNGVCAVCKKPGKFVIDHSHLTGKVRGLIHRWCNVVVGMVEKYGGLFYQANDYLEVHK